MRLNSLKNGLDKYRIMVGWSVYYDNDRNVIGMDVNHMMNADGVAPYFDRNIFFNFNDGEDALNYSTHKKADAKETEEAILKWKEQTPDVLYMYPRIEMIYEDIDLQEYKAVFYERSCKPWKGFLDYYDSKIYVHEDLIEELNLETYGRETYAKMSLF